MTRDLFDRYHDRDLHRAAAIERVEQALARGMTRIADAAAGITPTPGDAFRERLERRITADLARRHAISTAPDEVLHRRVNGETVITRRHLVRRTKGPSDHDDPA